jgi:hypothetical protein
MELYHFSRILGMKKKNEEGGYDFWPDHYRYCGKSFSIKPQTHVMIVLCNNCNENHAYNNRNCELIYDQKGQIQTIHLYNVETNDTILIHSSQTIGSLYYNYPSLIYGNGKIISEGHFFTNVIQSQEKSNCLKRYCIFSPTHPFLINIHRNNKNHQLLCNLSKGWTFFCICQSFKQNKFYFYPTSKYILIPVQCSNPNILQYYILCEKKAPLSLFHLSLSSIVQHNLNHTLNTKNNILPKTICEQSPNCHQYHLLPFGMSHRNIHCTGNGEPSKMISNW